MIAQVICFVVLLTASKAGIINGISYADDGGYYGGGIGIGGGSIGVHGGHHVVDYHTPAHYEFKYGVEDHKTGDRKQQSEVRVGDVVKGEYSLAEPDGTIRVVKYTADDHNGFNAVVSRIGHAVHPQVVVRKVVPVVHHDVGYGGLIGGGEYGGGLVGLHHGY